MTISLELATQCEPDESRVSRDLAVITALDFHLCNKVVGLGCGQPASDQDIAAIVQAYAARNQKHWMICLSPVAFLVDLGQRLIENGLHRGSNFAKMIRSTEWPPETTTDLRIAEIGVEARQTLIDTCLVGFTMLSSFGPWLGAAIGRPGWHHYLGYDGTHPVAVGALFVDGGIGWLGFGATVASHRNRGGQEAMTARRIWDAKAFNCLGVHTETGAETPESPNPSYRNMVRTGFELAYLRPNYILAP